MVYLIHIWGHFIIKQVIRGLVIDKEKGNLVKADRFGYIKRAMHGTRMLSTREVRYGLGFCVYLSAQI